MFGGDDGMSIDRAEFIFDVYISSPDYIFYSMTLFIVTLISDVSRRTHDLRRLATAVTITCAEALGITPLILKFLATSYQQ